ncbi:MAG TPA: hypothetical protein VGM32_08060, partial [Rhodopila sp.]
GAGERIAIPVRAGDLNDGSFRKPDNGAPRWRSSGAPHVIPRDGLASMLCSFRHWLRDREFPRYSAIRGRQVP